MNAVVEKILDSLVLALVLLGVAVFVIAAAGAVPTSPILPVSDPIWRSALALLGVGLVVVGLLKSRNDRPGIVRDRWKRYGFRIEGLTPGQTVRTDDGWLEVRGTYKTKPEADVVALFVTRQVRDLWWPMRPAVSFEAGNRWVGRVHLGSAPPSQEVIVLALVGPNGQVLRDYYEKVGARHGDYQPLDRLTDDTVECDSVIITKVS